MKFNNNEELKLFIKRLKMLDRGSTSIAYYEKNTNKVYKISNILYYKNANEIIQYDVDKFKGIKNDTYVFPYEIIYVKDEPYGFIMNYVDGKMLSSIDPLKIDLDMYTNASEKAVNDSIKLAHNDIVSNDVVFNTMLSNDRIKVIDTDSYDVSKRPIQNKINNNLSNINYSLKDFLTANLFEEFIESNKTLYDMYKDRHSNMKDFLIEFRKQLSEYKGNYISTLEEVKPVLNKKNRNTMFIRNIK